MNLFDRSIDAWAVAVWAEVWKFGFGIGCVILGVAWAYFGPVFKKAGLAVAIISGWGLICFTLGVTNERSLWVAKEQHTIELEQKAAADAEKSIEADPIPVPVPKPGWLRHNRHPDRYDRS